jgi:RNA recognition motif-containing protein
MNIYVGNLAPQVTEDQLREAFESFGAVSKVAIIKDKATGEARGFGFVEMPSNEIAQQAIESMNGKEIGGRALKVNEAKPKEKTGGRGGSRFGGGGRFNSGNGGGGRPRSQRY